MRLALAAALLLLAVAAPADGQEDRQGAAVVVPAGSYRPLYGSDSLPVQVASFRLDPLPVTVADFLAFLGATPRWRRDRAPQVFVGDHYLASWRGPLEPDPARGGMDRPVTEVSWFAARAFCAAAGGRLPTTDEWERAAAVPEDGWTGTRGRLNARFLDLMNARPGPAALAPVGRTVRNRLGVWDLHGAVWEWTEDFNDRTLTGAGRDDRGLDRQLFCAAGSAGVPDPSDYAAFTRASVRAALNGADGGLMVGFRCAYDPR